MIMTIQRSRVRVPDEEEGEEAIAPPPLPREYTIAESLEHLEIRFDEHQQFIQDRFDRQDRFLSGQADYQAAVNSSFGHMYHTFAFTASCDMTTFLVLPPYPCFFFDPAPADEEKHDD